MDALKAADAGLFDDLTPDQTARFADALKAAYPSFEELERLLFYEMEVRLKLITSDKLGLDIVVDQLIQWAVKNGRMRDLFFAALDGNRTNRKLLRFIHQSFMTRVDPQLPAAYQLLKKQLEVYNRDLLPLAEKWFLELKKRTPNRHLLRAYAESMGDKGRVGEATMAFMSTAAVRASYNRAR